MQSPYKDRKQTGKCRHEQQTGNAILVPKEKKHKKTHTGKCRRTWQNRKCANCTLGLKLKLKLLNHWFPPSHNDNHHPRSLQNTVCRIRHNDDQEEETAENKGICREQVCNDTKLEKNEEKNQ